jgi:hypothetical protein
MYVDLLLLRWVEEENATRESFRILYLMAIICLNTNHALSLETIIIVVFFMPPTQIVGYKNLLCLSIREKWAASLLDWNYT